MRPFNTKKSTGPLRVVHHCLILTLILSMLSIPGCGLALGVFLQENLEGFIVPLEEFDFDLCEEPPNGCGPSGVLVLLIPDCPLRLPCFTIACNTHDLCYRTCGTSQIDCDSEFRNTLDGICVAALADNPAELERCRRVLDIYVNVVTDAGGTFFAASQNFGCVCEDPNLNPNLANVVSKSARQPVSDQTTSINLSKSPDTDGDLLPDNMELTFGLDPLNPIDAELDDDGDGLINFHELIHGTNPFLADTDDDGKSDAQEVVEYQNAMTSGR